MIVRKEAVAERRRQIHCATGGTSGTKENTKSTPLVIDPRIIDDG